MIVREVLTPDTSYQIMAVCMHMYMISLMKETCLKLNAKFAHICNVIGRICMHDIKRTDLRWRAALIDAYRFL
jgi:hypothetical protein